MRLYLSSRDLPHPEALAALIERESLAGARAGLIVNAKDARVPEDRAESLAAKQQMLTTLGVSVSLVDLREHGADGESLRAVLQGLDFLWVMGGDSFVLRAAQRRSGFDRVVPALMEEGLVYAGDSAGAIVCGPSLEPYLAFDNPERAEERVLEGLCLVPFVVVPHWQAEGYENGPAVVRAVRAADLEPMLLEDGQAVVVDGKALRLLY